MACHQGLSDRPALKPAAPPRSEALEGILDCPAASGSPDQLAQRDDLGWVAAIERQLTGVGVTAHAV